MYEKKFPFSFVTVSILLLLSWLLMGVGLAADAVDNTLYAELLGKYVKNGVVDYKGLKNEEAKLDRYLKILEEIHPEALHRNEQFAFYINAYNAWTLKLILTAYPGLKSIKDLGSIFRSPWKKRIARIDGKVLTLDHIEHEILRPQMKDPRIHAVLNCASKSCPPLLAVPYSGKRLERQLEEQFSAFINDPHRNRLEGNTLYVSKIFDWYAEDFGGDVLGFFLKYARGDLKRRLEANRANITIKFLKYDWSLNGQ